MVGHQFLPSRQHHLVHAPFPNGVQPCAYRGPPCVSRVGFQPVRDGGAAAGRGCQGLAHEALHAARVHRTQRVHLQERAALVFDEHDLRQHELQAGKGFEQLVVGSRVFRVEPVEREEDRRLQGGVKGSRPFGRLHCPLPTRTFQLAFGLVERRQGDAAPQPHIAAGTRLVIVDELVGEPLLQGAERIHDVVRHGPGKRVYLGHVVTASARVLGFGNRLFDRQGRLRQLRSAMRAARGALLHFLLAERAGGRLFHHGFPVVLLQESCRWHPAPC